MQILKFDNPGAPEDLIQQHLKWIADHKNFNPLSKRKNDPEYYDLMVFHYRITNWSRWTNEQNERMVREFINRDNKLFEGRDSVSLALKETLAQLSKPDESIQWMFVTIGYNEQTITPSMMQKLATKVVDFDWVQSYAYVHEKHRENGIHHHTHFLIKYNKKLYKSKVLQHIYQKIKSFVLGKHFIDLLGPLNKSKPHASYETYLGYVNGEKQESKKQYLVLDQNWRKLNNLENIYIKL